MIPPALQAGDQVTPQEAAQELLRRQGARDSSLSFARYVDPTYQVNAFYRHLNETLDKVISGEIKKLMIFAPPQHGKSRTISEIFPARWLGVYPNLPVAIVSYVATPAQKFSTQARDIIESAEYARLYGELSDSNQPIRLREDSRAKNLWRLGYPLKGALWAGGIGGPITSHGFGLILIDDPFKGWKEARSLTIRNSVYEYYRHTLMTRLWEGGRQIIVMTRWDPDDLAGRLISEEGDEWAIIRYPAIAETQEERDANNALIGLPAGLDDPLGREAGEALSPERFSEEGLQEKEKSVGPRAWNHEYQGAPRMAEGDRIKREWFDYVAKAPSGARRIRYIDKAGTEGGGAYTAMVLMAEYQGTFYVEDVVRGQWSANQRETEIHKVIKRDTQMYGSNYVCWIEQEPGSGGKESAEHTIKKNAGYRIKADRPTGDKDARLDPFADQAEAGNVMLVMGLWNSAWLEELTSIPNGAYRDQADATAGAFNKLALKKPSTRLGRAKGLYGSRR